MARFIAILMLSGASLCAQEGKDGRSATNPSQKNLLLNGDFEKGSLEGWDGHHGDLQKEAKVCSEARFSGKQGVRIRSSGLGLGQSIKTQAGKTYYVSARIRVDQVIRKGSWGGIQFRVMNPRVEGWKPLNPETVVGLDQFTVGTWQRRSVSFVAASDVSVLLLGCFTDGQLEISADDVVLSPDPIPDEPVEKRRLQ